METTFNNIDLHKFTTLLASQITFCADYAIHETMRMRFKNKDGTQKFPHATYKSQFWIDEMNSYVKILENIYGSCSFCEVKSNGKDKKKDTVKC
jgi:hypothetical protein